MEVVAGSGAPETYVLGAEGWAVDADEQVERLFASEYAGLCRLATLLVGDRHRGEEIVMEAFLRTFTSWRRLRDRDAAPAYLRRAVVNIARSQLRRRLVEWRANARSHSAEQTRDTRSEPLHLDPVLQAVQALPSRQRAAVVLRYYADLPEAEIAATLGCSAGTVKSQLAKARKTLAARLTEEDLA
jgi:RNA polymerase sigma-70 factor (sigma-E family)